ncbi:hypothetical protein FACS1894177_09630 [Bacteroidia bacterium]|nr:hypothetical protein FACS1894177_09630 [Bacteroidia bacterium]
MDKFDSQTDSRKIKNPLHRSKLSADKTIIKNLPLCKTQDAQMQDPERG